MFPKALHVLNQCRLDETLQCDTDPSRGSVSVPRVVEVASKCLLRSYVRKEEQVGLKVAFTWQNNGKRRGHVQGDDVAASMSVNTRP